MELFEKTLLLPGYTREHQQKLAGSSVCVIGAGALGIPVIQYLSAAGVGAIGIVDNDRVEMSNLPRQILFSKNDIGKSKVSVLEQKLKHLYPDNNYVFYNEYLTDENAMYILYDYDVVIDACDNFQTRYLLDKHTQQIGIPFVYGSVHQYEGQVSIFNAKSHPENRTYQDLNPFSLQTDENACNQFGVWGPLPGIIGAIQAGEALKLLAGLEDTLSGRLLVYDAQTSTSKTFVIPKSQNEQKEPESHDQDIMNDDHAISISQLSNILTSGNTYYLINIEGNAANQQNIPGSIVLHPSKVAGFIKWIASDAVVVVYCPFGLRSSQLVKSLLPDCPDHIQLYHLSGGLKAWENRDHQPA